MKTHCNSIPIESLLLDEFDPREQAAIEEHLESCEMCQQKLAQVAADAPWWTAAAAHLSTVEQLQIPTPVQSRLANSSSFVVPTYDEASQRRPPSHNDDDWRRILDPPTHPEMLGRIDQFEIEDKIGAGGMGIVLKGFDRHLNRAVAIKILAPHLASNGTSRKRFEREAQAAAAVVHPNVIPIYAVNSCPSRPYIVMQLVSGHSLHSLVQEKGPLDVKEIVRIAIQVAAGLAAAHAQGLIHRDIKPANILIEHDVSRVVITDFGLARAVDDAGMTQTGWIAGTPHYMSPEQASGENLDSRTDLFSLGGLLYFLATGRVPFRGDKPFAVIQKILNENPTAVQAHNGEIPLMLSDIIEKLLEKNPADRFASATAVQSFLERYLAHLQQPLRASKPQRVLTRRRKNQRTRIVAALTCAAMLLTIATSWFAWHTNVRACNDPTSTSPGAGETWNAPPAGFPSFFADDGFASEIESTAEQTRQLEMEMQLNHPLDHSFGSISADPSNSYFAEMEQLEAITDSLERTEQPQIQSLKRLLDQTKPTN